MSRMDLLNKNLPIIEGIAREYAGGDGGTVFIIVTNPVDVLTYVFWRRSGVERHRVAGLSGVLDSSRLKTIMRSRGIRVSGLSSFVLGEHGENMVILRDRMREEYGLSDTELDTVQSETVKAAAEIISMKGATVHGPGASIARMVKAVLSDSREILPASAVLNGEYGIRNVCLGVPVEAGRNGFRIVQEKLGENEESLLRKAAENVSKALEQIGYG